MVALPLVPLVSRRSADRTACPPLVSVREMVNGIRSWKMQSSLSWRFQGESAAERDSFRARGRTAVSLKAWTPPATVPASWPRGFDRNGVVTPSLALRRRGGSRATASVQCTTAERGLHRLIAGPPPRCGGLGRCVCTEGPIEKLGIAGLASRTPQRAIGPTLRKVRADPLVPLHGDSPYFGTRAAARGAPLPQLEPTSRSAAHVPVARHRCTNT